VTKDAEIMKVANEVLQNMYKLKLGKYEREAFVKAVRGIITLVSIEGMDARLFEGEDYEDMQ